MTSIGLEQRPTRWAKRVYLLLEGDRSKGLSLISKILVGLVLLSFVTLALETEAARSDTPLPAWVGQLVNGMNIGIVLLFAVEYVVRLVVAGENPHYRGFGGRVRYAFTPLALADLAAFLPELVLSFFAPEIGGQMLAALRALRLFRLFKLVRYVPAFSIVGSAFRRSGPALLATLAVAGTLVYVAALLLYLIEGHIPGQSETFGSIVRALWWAVVSLTTVGYGDAYPVTPLGRIAAAVILISFVGIVAMPTGILASAFAEEFRERHEQEKSGDDRAE